MSAPRERVAPRPPAWVVWGGPLLMLLALALAGAGALQLPGKVVDGRPSAPRPLEDLLAPETLAVLEEVGKQAIEQPLHVLMAAAPICLSRQLTMVPWYGWAITPLLVWREWSQWPSKRWWDPPLDWAFLTLGVVVATWRRRGRPAANPPALYPRPPSHPLRQKYASRPAASASISASANG